MMGKSGMCISSFAQRNTWIENGMAGKKNRA